MRLFAYFKKRGWHLNEIPNKFSKHEKQAKYITVLITSSEFVRHSWKIINLANARYTFRVSPLKCIKYLLLGHRRVLGCQGYSSPSWRSPPLGRVSRPQLCKGPFYFVSRHPPATKWRGLSWGLGQCVMETFLKGKSRAERQRESFRAQVTTRVVSPDRRTRSLKPSRLRQGRKTGPAGSEGRRCGWGLTLHGPNSRPQCACDNGPRHSLPPDAHVFRGSAFPSKKGGN